MCQVDKGRIVMAILEMDYHLEMKGTPNPDLESGRQPAFDLAFEAGRDKLLIQILRHSGYAYREI